MSNPNMSAILAALLTKRRVFISYHHARDQLWYNILSPALTNHYECAHDSSLDRACDSDDCDYVMRRIRENYIKGTTCTIVLCGSETFGRKYVDWEIKATLDRGHGLIGVRLPTAVNGNLGKTIVPDRLHQNIESGYAVWIDWADALAGAIPMKTYIETSIAKSAYLIRNDLPLKTRNS